MYIKRDKINVIVVVITKKTIHGQTQIRVDFKGIYTGAALYTVCTL